MIPFDPLIVAMAAAAATVIACLLSCLPALHIYNLLGLVLWFGVFTGAEWLDHPLAAGCAVASVVAFSIANSLPSIFLGAPDESAVLTVLPGQKLMMQGRGMDALMSTAAGGMVALLVMSFILGPVLPSVAKVVHRTLRPHSAWIIWSVITFMLMSEWPKGGTHHATRWERLYDGWRSTGAGLITFLLSGWLGFVLFYRPPIAHEVAFQNLMPAFVGLFSVPWLVMNVASRADIPEQIPHTTIGCTWRELATGSLSGLIGGLFAGYVPGVTGGVGGMLAGHASAQRDEHVFLAGQGASKASYYTAGFLLFMTPDLTISRGGSWILKSIYTPGGLGDYLLVLECIVIAACLSFLLMIPLARALCRFVSRLDYRRVSLITLGLCILLVLCMTGPAGFGVMLTASLIGFIPVIHHSRRLNALGIILLPIACNISGIGIPIARWLGLL